MVLRAVMDRANGPDPVKRGGSGQSAASGTTWVGTPTSLVASNRPATLWTFLTVTITLPFGAFCTE